MARNIFCHHCNIKVGEIVNGSLLRKGTIHICVNCVKDTTKESDTPFVDDYMKQYGNDVFNFGDVFKDIFKDPKK